MALEMFYDDDADLSIIQGRKVAVIGYGVSRFTTNTDANRKYFEFAKAMGIDTLHQIDTGLDPVTAEREQWDDGNNTLCIAPRVAVAYERNTQTNARLESAGIEVVAISGNHDAEQVLVHRSPPRRFRRAPDASIRRSIPIPRRD